MLMFALVTGAFSDALEEISKGWNGFGFRGGLKKIRCFDLNRACAWTKTDQDIVSRMCLNEGGFVNGVVESSL